MAAKKKKTSHFDDVTSVSSATSLFSNAVADVPPLEGADSHPWIADGPAEQVLRQLGLDFTIERVFIANIDRSYRNRGRVNRPGHVIPGQPNADRIDQFKMQTFSAHFQNACHFPMPVLHRHAPDVFWIMGGYHRTFAADNAGLNSIVAYVIHVTDDIMMDTLPFLLNDLNGLGLTDDERLEHAAYLVGRWKLTPEQVESSAGISHHRIGNYLRVKVVMEELDQCGIRVDTSKVSHTALLAIHEFRNLKAVFPVLGRLVVRYNLNGKQLSSLCQTLKQNKTDVDKLAVLKRCDDSLKAASQLPSILTSGAKAKRNGGTARLPIRQKLLISLNGLVNRLSSAKEASDLQLSNDEVREEVRASIQEINIQASRLGLI